MPKDIWVSLSTKDRVVLRKALSHYSRLREADTNAVDGLLQKLKPTQPYPDITIGVHGGQVQWTLGNPFPVRVCDYDGDKDDLPSVDARGQRCRLWFEPPQIKS